MESNHVFMLVYLCKKGSDSPISYDIKMVPYTQQIETKAVSFELLKSQLLLWGSLEANISER